MVEWCWTKTLTLEMRLGSLNRLVVKQMCSLLQKLMTHIVKVIEIDDIHNGEDDNQYDRNSNNRNDESDMQQGIQSDQNEHDVQDVILNDHDRYSDADLHLE